MKGLKDNVLALNVEAAGWRTGTLGKRELQPNRERQDLGKYSHYVEKDLN